ncbi:helix-turn-helix domain-containing protein [Fictibacillus terranigra]|uniref:Helix-turn-helix transcriptional regulator n=1 Tax=Fictibacillus terranigra TaxID=3058424 RepID=A0ABT8E4R6_9BACL|nr:helix-turn-helix transcriptional regulator [Fictibacillus sp. CENA-BCM004]MDN4072899.1 helix-turn-helix transcriptional regulator [Fictibacillus sp. CENA-BCM004]
MTLIGYRIKSLREQNNWSQLTLSKKIGINNSVLSRIEAGKRSVEDDLITKFAKAFDVSSDYLLGHTDDLLINESSPKENDFEDWPEAYNVLRRANEKLTPKEKQKMLRLIEDLFLDDEEEEQTNEKNGGDHSEPR